MRRRDVAAAAVGLAGLTGCGGAQSAAAPTEAPPAPTTVPPYQIQVRVQPQDPRAGQDEHVVVMANFRTREGRPVSGAQMSAVVNYPSGPKTYSAEITTFPDGRIDLQVPVAPAQRGQNVRVEVVMRYRGQEFRQAAGFTVR